MRNGSRAASGRAASRVCTSTGNHRFGVVTNARRETRSASSTKRRCSAGPPTCSITAFENAMSNSSSSKGSASASPWTYLRLRIALAKARPFVHAERRHLLRPRVQRLEEVQCPAARVLAEGDVVDADVEHRRRLGRRHRLHEEAELPPARAKGDRVGEAHRPARVRCGAVIEDVVRPRGPYRLHLMTYRRPAFETPLPGGRRGQAWQRSDGLVVLRAPDEESLELLRFMLALDSDTTEFAQRFRTRPAARPLDPEPARPSSRSAARPSPTRSCGPSAGS